MALCINDADRSETAENHTAPNGTLVFPPEQLPREVTRINVLKSIKGKPRILQDDSPAKLCQNLTADFQRVNDYKHGLSCAVFQPAETDYCDAVTPLNLPLDGSRPML